MIGRAHAELTCNHNINKTVKNLNLTKIQKRFPSSKIQERKWRKNWKVFTILGNYTLNSPGGHSTNGLFANSGLTNGTGPPVSFLNGGSSLANLGLMTNSHGGSMMPPNLQNQSPTSVLSNYSLNRNLNQLNLNLVPRNNR